MKNKHKFRFALSLALAVCSLAVLTNSCKEEEKLFAALNGSETTILLGQTFQFNLSLSAIGDASTEGVTAKWSVADPAIASVSQSGLVTALEVGTTVVTAQLSTGDYVTSMVTVEKPKSILFSRVNGQTSVMVEELFLQPEGTKDSISLSLNPDELDVEAGVKVYSADTTVVRVEYFTEAVADSGYFILRPYVEGDTRIYVENGDLKTYCDVHVGAVVTMGWDASLQTTSNSMKVFKQDEPFQLVVYTQVLPDDSQNYWQTEGMYEWTVEQKNEANPAALIENFDQSVKGRITWTVTPKELGTTKMTVKARGQEVSLVLKVVDKEKVAVNSIRLEFDGEVVGYSAADSTFIGKVTAQANVPLAFSAVTNPQNAAATWPITWYSSDPTVAVYDETLGVVRTLKDGSTVISIKSKDLEAKCELTVKTDVTGLTINVGSRSTLMVGDKEQLTFTATPAGVNPTVEWVSSDPSVAIVDAEGVVHALKPGKTSITAKVGNVVSAPKEMTVVEALSDYSYDNAMYQYTFSAGNLDIQAQVEGQEVSVLRAKLATASNESGTYTVGSNMSDVTFTFNGVTATITSGTITVSGNYPEQEFDIDLKVELEGNTISLKGKLILDNLAG